MSFQNLNKEMEIFCKLYNGKSKALHKLDITNLEKKFVKKSLDVNEVFAHSKYTKKFEIKFLKNKTSVRAAWQLLSNVNYLKMYSKMNLSNSNDLFKKIINIPSGSKVLSKLKKK